MAKNKNPSSHEIYTLHIDVEPQQQKTPHTHHSKKNIKVNLPHVPATKLKASSNIFRRLWDALEFACVSVLVFGIIYGGLNWQALYENGVHYFNVWRGYESPLNKITEDSPQIAERLSVVASGTRGTAKDAIPPLSLEIYPPDMRIVIPRINKNVPVVGVKNENLIARQWEELEADIQKALRNGVVHYPGTALPGENGNIVLTGHSSYYAWDPGRFKDVFALLHDVRKGDKVVIFFNQKKYLYEIEEKKIVLPKEVDVLRSANKEQLTLITCTPIGTNLKRLVVIGKLLESSS